MANLFLYAHWLLYLYYLFNYTLNCNNLGALNTFLYDFFNNLRHLNDYLFANLNFNDFFNNSINILNAFKRNMNNLLNLFIFCLIHYFLDTFFNRNNSWNFDASFNNLLDIKRNFYGFIRNRTTFYYFVNINTISKLSSN
jgi:hypothetical protein